MQQTTFMNGKFKSVLTFVADPGMEIKQINPISGNIPRAQFMGSKATVQYEGPSEQPTFEVIQKHQKNKEMISRVIMMEDKYSYDKMGKAASNLIPPKGPKATSAPAPAIPTTAMPPVMPTSGK